MRAEPEPVNLSARPGQRHGAVAFAILLCSIGGIAGIASAYWDGTSSTTTSFAAADTILPGTQPTLTVSGSNASLTWTASTTSTGAPVDGYIVARSDANNVASLVTGDCGRTVAGLTCSEVGLTNGTWRYTVTPVIGRWQGPPGVSQTITVGAVEATRDGQLVSTTSNHADALDTDSVQTSTSVRDREPNQVPTTPPAKARRTTTSTAVAATAVPLSTATRLAFGVQPTGQVAGVPFSPDLVVRIEDGSGNLTTSNATVSLALVADGVATNLVGTLTMSAVNGLATFRGLSVTKSGTFSVSATSAGLTSTTSDQFNIAPGPASQLVVVAQPRLTSVNSVVAPNVTVEVRDAFNNPTVSAVSVTLALANNANGATLLGTTTVEALGGMATFSNLAVDRPGTGYLLTATANGLGSTISAPFDVDSTPQTTSASSSNVAQPSIGVTAANSQSPWWR